MTTKKTKVTPKNFCYVERPTMWVYAALGWMNYTIEGRTAFSELKAVCKDSSHQIPDDAKKYLIDRSLIHSDGQVEQFIRIIVLSETAVKELDLIT
jgi:hypothetical protein